jgi:hypothetical protein
MAGWWSQLWLFGCGVLFVLGFEALNRAAAALGLEAHELLMLGVVAVAVVLYVGGWIEWVLGLPVTGALP